MRGGSGIACEVPREDAPSYIWFLLSDVDQDEMNTRLVGAGLLLVLSACNSQGTSESGAVIAKASRPASSLSSPAPTAKSVASRFSWRRFESPDLHLTFEFPTPPGQTRYEFPESHSESGTSFAFWIQRTDLPDAPPPYGWSYAFAGGASTDLTAPRMSWITDNVAWEQRDREFRVLIGTGSYRVEPIRIVSRSDGLRALIFDPNRWFWGGQEINPEKTDRAAVLNFPAGYHASLKGITFYFFDETPLADIERVVRSVRFGVR